MSYATSFGAEGVRSHSGSSSGLLFDLIPSIGSLFSVKGRMNRTGYFFVQVFQTSTLILLALTAEHILSRGVQDVITIATPLIQGHGHRVWIDEVDQFGGADVVRYSVFGLFGLAWAWIGVAANIRRFHDLNMSGWWLLGIGLLNAIFGFIPVLGGLLSLGVTCFICFGAGTEGENNFGPQPNSVRVWSRMTAVPRHIWRGETPLINMLLIYVFFFNFLLLDKGCSELAAALDVSTGGLLFVGALLLLNMTMAIGLWRSANISEMRPGWRFFGRLVAIVLACRVGYTLLLLTVDGTSSAG